MLNNLLAAVTTAYQPMTDIPFLSSWKPSSSFDGSASAVFNSLFTLSITLGAMLAVFMFIVGGLQMITARDSAGSVGEGKKKMTNAVFGLLMLLSTFLILNTINPQLTQLTFLNGVGGLNALDATPPAPPKFNTGSRDAIISERTRRNTPPRTTNTTSDGGYCYTDTSINNGNPTCFATSADCTNATSGTRGEGTCENWQSRNNARRWTELENDNIEVYCKAKSNGACDSSGFYTKETCSGASCKTTPEPKTTVIIGGKYKVSGTNESYSNEEACKLRAITKGKTCISN